MRRPIEGDPVSSALPSTRATPAARRNRLAILFGVATIAALALSFIVAKDMKFLMPGPLASAHAAIENCNACHTRSGSGKLSWLHGLVAGDRLADSQGCLSCHKMAETAFNAHSAPAEALSDSTARLAKIVAETPSPTSAVFQNAVFPTDRVVARGLYCTTCHQEHQGAGFDLTRISGEQCRSCHVVKFDSFDGHHPQLGAFPFSRRSRIIFDHNGHFSKHFPETAKGSKAAQVPTSCASCHTSRKDKRLMAVVPFEQTCSGCHLGQITGQERANGPKGIAFLSLPGLDLQTLKKRKAAIGEWPEASEAELTPFMKVLIGRNERGRSLLKAIARLNLQDLSGASASQIGAVTNLAWEIKGLLYALIKNKASDALGRMSADGTKLGSDLIGDLTAGIPRDVLVRAYQQWLPNLATEMANRPQVAAASGGEWVTTTSEGSLSLDAAAGSADKDAGGERSPARRRAVPPAAAAERDAGAGGEARAEPVAPAVSKPSAKAARSDDRPPPKTADQTDDLLHPTDEEMRAMRAGVGGGGAGGKAAAAAEPAARRPEPAPARAKADAGRPAAKPEDDARSALASAAPSSSIETDVDAENWAAYGGWYRQDHTIFYRPTGHKDKLIHAWLLLTGPKSKTGDGSAASAVFDFLTGKDAQGSCSKCHSVDEAADKRRTINFAPVSIDDKAGRFTTFSHEPHLGILDQRGCLTCHDLEKSSPYLKSYEQGDPKVFASSFKAVKKELCQTCHTSGMARQDCLLCHKYHLGGAAAPMMSTRVPEQ